MKYYISINVENIDTLLEIVEAVISKVKGSKLEITGGILPSTH